MTKPDKCKNIQCIMCGNYKYCTDREQYQNNLDNALADNNIQKAKKIVREWKNL